MKLSLKLSLGLGILTCALVSHDSVNQNYDLPTTPKGIEEIAAPEHDSSENFETFDLESFELAHSVSTPLTLAC